MARHVEVALAEGEPPVHHQVLLAVCRGPTSVASTVMANSPVVMVLFAWLLLASPPRSRHLAGVESASRASC